MARLAWSNASRAMRDGKLIEARGWTRLHNDLTVLVKLDRDIVRAHRRWAEKPETIGHIPLAPPVRPMEED